MYAILFTVRKLLARLLFPVGLVALLWLAGAVLWLRRPGRRLGPALMAAAGVLLAALSLPPVGQALLAPLEDAAGGYARPADLAAQSVRRIVVLSGSHRVGPLTPADRLGASTTLRLLEGLRLWRGVPGALLVLSGGSFTHQASAAGDMASLAKELGVPAGAIVTETGSWDTADQARALHQRLGDEPFALVTSATHMPRALMLFRCQGLRPVPAPADFVTRGDGGGLWRWLPQASGLKMAQQAAYEYLGLAWAWLTISCPAG